MSNVLDINRKRAEAPQGKSVASGVIKALGSKSPTLTYRGIVIASRTIADWFRSQACGVHVEEIGHNNAVVTLYPCDVNPDGTAKKLGLLRWWKATRKKETWQTDSHRTEMSLDALLSYSAKLLGGNISFQVKRSIPKHVLPYTTANAVDSIVEKQRKFWQDAGL